jgi:HK97 family phage major capsid protein
VAREDDKGLLVGGNVLDTAHGMDVRKLLAGKVCRYLSIGFDVLARAWLEKAEDVKKYWDTVGYTPTEQDTARSQYGALLFTDVQVYEASPVMVPGNDYAEITSVRGAALERLPLDEHLRTALATAEEISERIEQLATLRAADGRGVPPERRAVLRQMRDRIDRALAASQPRASEADLRALRLDLLKIESGALADRPAPQSGEHKMAISAKRKELLSRFETRKKELDTFLAERGDNITAEDLTKAHGIRDDLRGIQTEIVVESQATKLRGEQQEFNDFLNKPTPAMRHQAVVGQTAAGDTVLGRRKGSKSLRVLQQHGVGIFGKRQFEAANAPEYRQGMRDYFAGRYRSKHFRNLEEGLDPQGGYLAPIETIARLIQRKATPTNVQGLTDVINSTRDAISLPRVSYTGASDDSGGTIYSTGFRVTSTDENPTSDTQALVADTNLFGTTRVSVYTWLIEGILTNNQVEDSMFDPMAWMNGKFVETVELLRDNMILNGTGINMPHGLLENPGGDDFQPAVVNSGVGAAPWLAPDGLISISEDIPEQYDDNCRYIFKKTTTGKTIRLFKDAQGRYLFARGVDDSGIVPGRQKTVNGYPCVYSQFMPNPGSNTFPIIFGDLMGYTLVNRIGFSVQVLREVAARRNQVIVLGRVRFGGQVLEPWRLRVQKCAA